MKVQTPMKKAEDAHILSSIERVCVDLAKSNSHVVGIDAARRTVFRKKFSRSAFLEWLKGLDQKVMAMEACAGSQWWGQQCQALGHTPMLSPPHRVKPLR